MTRFIPRVAIIAGVVLISAALSVGAAEEKKPVHAPKALPGVEPEMLSPDYWIALQPDADAVIMSPADIEKFNGMVRTKTVRLRDFFGRTDPLEGGLLGYTDLEKRGSLMHPVQPLELPDTVPGDSLRVWFANLETWLKSRDFYDGRNAIYSDQMKKDLIADMNASAIPSRVTRRFGIVVTHSEARFFPTDVPGYSDTRVEMDLFQGSSLRVGKPVAILHTSVNGDFYYVESPIQRGWVAAENVAVGTRAEVKKLALDKNFLMAASHRVPVYGDPKFRSFARYLYYSSTMPFEKKDVDGYIVKMPYRRPDGMIGVARGYIRPDADVHRGFFPYTKRNVIAQIFKLLDQPYGWLDQDNKRACSGTMHALLQCFGIEVGSLPSFILLAPDRVTYFDPKLSVEEKTREVEKLEPVITMAGNAGHIVMLLGKAKNGKMYFMHQAGWGYKEGDQDYIVNRTTLNPVDFKWYHISGPNVFSTFRP